MLSAGVRLGGSVVGLSVVCSCDRAIQVLKERAAQAGLSIIHSLNLTPHSSLTSQIQDFIYNKVVRIS